MPDEFRGFPRPKRQDNWFELPDEWIDITREIKSLAELKVITFIARHTWGYQEYGLFKHITTDEFLHGRRCKVGSEYDKYGNGRMDRGTGLSNRSIIDGIRAGLSHGYIIEEVDDRDRGRIKKYYSLVMLPENGDKSDMKEVHRRVKFAHNRREEASERTREEPLDGNSEEMIGSDLAEIWSLVLAALAMECNRLVYKSTFASSQLLSLSASEATVTADAMAYANLAKQTGRLEDRLARVIGRVVRVRVLQG